MSAATHGSERKFLDKVRSFNKHIFNRFTLALTRAGLGPYTIIYHTGRRSGRVYQTPVLATCIREMALIPLPYGEHVDWLRNILAAEGCTMFRKGHHISATHPVVLDGATALALLPEKRRRLFARFSIPSFLQLQVPHLR